MFATFKEHLSLYVRDHPTVYYATHRLRGRPSDMAVNRDTQLVIEGFPRTGNTFAVTAFQSAQPGPVNVAHHLHAQAQIIRAAHWRVPCLTLVRTPVDAVLSMRIRLPQFSTAQALRYYASFYETATRYRDSYVLGRFEEVTTNFGRVIERVNAKFGTGFTPFEHTEENVRLIFSRIEDNYRSQGQKVGIARPSAARKDLKEIFREELQRPEHEPPLRRAEAAYERLASTG